MNRKRKLTWIEKKQIEKMAFDHPFFDIPGSVLSKKEAEAIIRSAEARKSGVLIVSEACDKAGVPRPDFVDNHSSVFDNLKEIVAIPAIRRIGIIVIALILLVVFFTATPTGRAIAESVIRYIGTMLDDGRVVYNRNDNTVQMNPVFRVPDSEEGETLEQECNIIDVDSFEAFAAATGVRPKVLPYPHAKLYYDHDEFTDYLELHAEYETPKGTIITSQIWNVLDLGASTSTGFSVYDADPSVCYSIEENGWITVMKLYEDSIFRILAKDSYTAEELVNLLTIE